MSASDVSHSLPPVRIFVADLLCGVALRVDLFSSLNVYQALPRLSDPTNPTPFGRYPIVKHITGVILLTATGCRQSQISVIGGAQVREDANARSPKGVSHRRTAITAVGLIMLSLLSSASPTGRPLALQRSLVSVRRRGRTGHRRAFYGPSRRRSGKSSCSCTATTSVPHGQCVSTRPTATRHRVVEHRGRFCLAPIHMHNALGAPRL